MFGRDIRLTDHIERHQQRYAHLLPATSSVLLWKMTSPFEFRGDSSFLLQVSKNPWPEVYFPNPKDPGSVSITAMQMQWTYVYRMIII